MNVDESSIVSSSETDHSDADRRKNRITDIVRTPAEEVVDHVRDAHQKFCWYTNERARELETNPIALPVLSMESDDGVDSSSMNAKEIERLRLWVAFAKNFARNVPKFVEFAKFIPSFDKFLSDDKIALIKYAVYEIWLCYTSILSTETEIVFEDGSALTKEQLAIMYDSDFATDILHVTTSFRELYFEDDEVAMVVAIVLMAPDRPGLREPLLIEYSRNELLRVLRNRLDSKPDKTTLVYKLAEVIYRIRVLRERHWVHLSWLRQHVQNLPTLPIDYFFVELFELRPPPEEEQEQKQEQQQDQELEITVGSSEIIDS